MTQAKENKEQHLVQSMSKKKPLAGKLAYTLDGIDQKYFAILDDYKQRLEQITTLDELLYYQNKIVKNHGDDIKNKSSPEVLQMIYQMSNDAVKILAEDPGYSVFVYNKQPNDLSKIPKNEIAIYFDETEKSWNFIVNEKSHVLAEQDLSALIKENLTFTVSFPTFDSFDQVTSCLNGVKNSTKNGKEGKSNLQDEKSTERQVFIAQMLLAITEREGLLNDTVSTQVQSPPAQDSKEQDKGASYPLQDRVSITVQSMSKKKPLAGKLAYTLDGIDQKYFAILDDYKQKLEQITTLDELLYYQNKIVKNHGDDIKNKSSPEVLQMIYQMSNDAVKILAEDPGYSVFVYNKQPNDLSKIPKNEIAIYFDETEKSWNFIVNEKSHVLADQDLSALIKENLTFTVSFPTFDSFDQVTSCLDGVKNSTKNGKEGKSNLQDEKSTERQVFIAQMLLAITEREGLLNDAVSTQVQSPPAQDSKEQDKEASSPLKDRVSITYPYGKEGKSRSHFYTVEHSDPKYKDEKGNPLRGDALKRYILNEFKKEVEQCATLDKLNELFARFKTPDNKEYKILATHQRPQLFCQGKPTSAIQAVDQMYLDAVKIFAPKVELNSDSDKKEDIEPDYEGGLSMS
ncbi:hypothetical protein MJ258_14055 [Legionella sp. EUR-108]|uniref:hypothetical protein n=1 Tax=Legionella maioricensis TaxID=2896528 RepID=UPI0020284DE5|nr:hypothetical protein [Legionella maioricensis]MCL9688644.1 hypothetical protein [Legionella maioricensis]